MPVMILFAASLTVIGAVMVITRRIAVHAVLWLVVTFLALACVFTLLGAPFAAALEVIIYAGAIMVLFIFVIMMIGPAQPESDREKEWLRPRAWLGPAILATLLCGELLFGLRATPHTGTPAPITPRDVGLSLFGPCVMMVELASFLLLAGLVTAFHIGRHRPETP
ncbi:NADH-quinone oxidoreductase subunit J [Acetobacter oeni]|uniref:NADH-quinone oxidoreductase subunit J n=1 Tax=Acetobacter oeni TaxID=304077 RepID=A0A511XH77_9PROT|nr:NADH-quinone oxidoreductase subunit J [Acetobacter oeni]MBB3882450.1 NADH-quinone oxidoreductase subunit J [Acetobacter oeni]NHO18456.1 NADH-quinone oxidoreductase subunit J [Acetobacter oeni]GBR06236.1 NADH-quinone oxidoreductase chain J [Acetobacter oeni LMG 21952]GEN62305.1 NADH:ubiquinone oxidoreductase subunit J [Acetobacter oeni]